MISHYRFFNHRFKFQYIVSNGCHDLAMLSINISDIAIIVIIIIIIIIIITIEDVDYHSIIHNISKSEPINLSKNSHLYSFFKS